MTPQEALDFFESFLKLIPANPYKESAECSIIALKKQIPKKVKVEKYDIGGNDYFCPCGCKTQSGQYCRDCGQALDWGDSE